MIMKIKSVWPQYDKTYTGVEGWGAGITIKAIVYMDKNGVSKPGLEIAELFSIDNYILEEI